MYVKNRVLTALLAALALSAASAQADISIGFFDKRVYVPGSEVLVKVTIRNGTPEAWRFKLADDKRLSVAFDVRSLANRALEPSDSWKRAMSSSSPVFYRELSIQPGEEYSFVENLTDYVAVTEPGSFIVVCTLHPELSGRSDPSLSIRSNALSLSVRPGAPTPSVVDTFKEGTAEILKAERIGPDEVVSRTISARQKGKWNEFFLYLDVERLLKANADKSRSYDRESDDGRRRMISSYKADLMASVADTDIVMIPSSFEIVETRYGSSYGKVVVMQKFDYDGFKMLKEYIYELERRDDVWYIVGYSVKNKGTE
ncbi:MAG: hypothetical protein CVV47_05200 [Spirochaetae bacterium HGW-Spirochaetae-3]|nr:MAG: hypothetical protein CVV47_05200 [Spirochaetae bacterium HGW-Spirochaetae-3]